MVHKIVRTAAFAIAAAALTHASDFRSGRVNIPFPFQVSKKMLPAGEYRVEKNLASESAILTNVQTRRSVQILLPNNTFDKNGTSALKFVANKAGYKLTN